jgi:hypothetical protein
LDSNAKFLGTVAVCALAAGLLNINDALEFSQAVGAQVRMFKVHLHPDDLPLFSQDMETCQQVFDIVRSEAKIEAGSARSDLLASHIIHFYKSGIRAPEELIAMARTGVIG